MSDNIKIASFPFAHLFLKIIYELFPLITTLQKISTPTYVPTNMLEKTHFIFFHNVQFYMDSEQDI